VKADRHLKRTDLFLVRLWIQSAGDDSGRAELHGKVQRVVDGESHQFKDWQGLMESLQGMISETGVNRPTNDPSR
jgi:hypothetical protein